jgi:hypothetical protein
VPETSALSRLRHARFNCGSYQCGYFLTFAPTLQWTFRKARIIEVFFTPRSGSSTFTAMLNMLNVRSPPLYGVNDLF